jgi:pimeloyl-ACP methyl ester carboxylesterase
MNVDWRAAAVDAHARIIRLPCPVAFATAQGDRWCPVGPLVAELEAVAAERAGETERVDWEYSGHFIFDDAPDDTAKLVAKVVHKCLEQLYRSGAG